MGVGNQRASQRLRDNGDPEIGAAQAGDEGLQGPLGSRGGGQATVMLQIDKNPTTD